jgi:hypothetical protein
MNSPIRGPPIPFGAFRGPIGRCHPKLYVKSQLIHSKGKTIMATKGQSIPEKISRLEILSISLKTNGTDVPFVNADQTQLEDLVGKAKALQVQQEIQKAQLQETNKQLTALTRSGAQLRTRMRAALQGHYGFDNKKLIEFGLQPVTFSGRRKKASSSTVNPPAQPATPVTPATPEAGSNPAKA